VSRVKTARRKAGKAQKAAGHAGQHARKTATQTVAPRLETARDSAVAYAGDAADWVQPRYEQARDRVRSDVAPRVNDAVNRGLTASEPFRDEALSRGTATLAALRGEVEAPRPRRRRRAKRFLLALGLLGAAAGAVAAWARMSEQGMPSTVDEERSRLAGSVPETGTGVDVRDDDSPNGHVDVRDAENSQRT
jgi:hypothetical protein